MLNITAVMSAIVQFFKSALTWMQTHGIRIGDSQISFFTLAVVFIIVGVLLSALLPWFNDEEE